MDDKTLNEIRGRCSKGCASGQDTLALMREVDRLRAELAKKAKAPKAKVVKAVGKAKAAAKKADE